jgi:hypothetical protein
MRRFSALRAFRIFGSIRSRPLPEFIAVHRRPLGHPHKTPLDPRPLEAVKKEVEELLHGKLHARRSPEDIERSSFSSVRSIARSVNGGSSIMICGTPCRRYSSVVRCNSAAKVRSVSRAINTKIPATLSACHSISSSIKRDPVVLLGMAWCCLFC